VTGADVEDSELVEFSLPIAWDVVLVYNDDSVVQEELNDPELLDADGLLEMGTDNDDDFSTSELKGDDDSVDTEGVTDEVGDGLAVVFLLESWFVEAVGILVDFSLLEITVWLLVTDDIVEE